MTASLAISFAEYNRPLAMFSKEAIRLAKGEIDVTLAYAPDEDLSNGDPLVNLFDLGDDPLAYAKRRFTLSKELWARVQQRQPQPGDDPLRARRLARGAQARADGVRVLVVEGEELDDALLRAGAVALGEHVHRQADVVNDRLLSQRI